MSSARWRPVAVSAFVLTGALAFAAFWYGFNQKQAKESETLVMAYYSAARSYFDNHGHPAADAKSLIREATQESKPYMGFFDPLAQGEFLYYPLENNCWVVVSLKGHRGIVAAERIDTGGEYRKRLQRIRPHVEEIVVEE